MDSVFGQQLKDERRRQNITQAELAGDDFSASYVSLVESGRRPPSEPFLHRAAEVLGKDVHELRTWGRSQSSQQADLVELVMAVQRASAADDLPEAIRVAEVAAEIARANGDSGTWWSLTAQMADLHRLQGDYAAARKLLVDLAQSPIYRHSPSLVVATHTRLSVVERFLGNIEAAVEEAQTAVSALDGPGEDRPLRDVDGTEALMALVAAMTQAGRHEELQSVVDRLLPAVEDDAQPLSIRGQLAWALGNVAFARGRFQDGTALHDRAKQLLRPEHDLRVWTQFHWAAAATRLRHGLADETTRRYMDDGAQAAALLGSAWAGSMAGQVLQIRWAAQTGEPEDVIRLAVPLLETPDESLVGTESAELHQIVSDAYRSLGDIPSASRHLVEAARWYAEANMSAQAAEILSRFALLESTE